MIGLVIRKVQLQKRQRVIDQIRESNLSREAMDQTDPSVGCRHDSLAHLQRLIATCELLSAAGLPHPCAVDAGFSPIEL